MAYFEIKKLQKSFGSTDVLKGVDVTLEKGEVLTIIGSSGSGKTTLLRTINFLETANSGQMVLDGEVLFDGAANQSEKELRQKRLNFGLVFQSFNLFPQYNVIKNITLAPTLLLKEKVAAFQKEGKEQGLKGKELRDKVNTFKAEQKSLIETEALSLLDKIGLSDKVNSYPCELSGGQCQRVAIARALALSPKILCFDEPTSALDPELTGEVLRVIRSLKSEGRTMIIVTHEMSFAKSVSDKVVFLADGQVEEVGDPISVFESPKSLKLQKFFQSFQEGEQE